MPRLLTCPQCGARYRVPDAAIDGAKTVRCNACGETWVEGADAEALELEDLQDAMVNEPVMVRTAAPVGAVAMKPGGFNAATALREAAYQKRRGKKLSVIRFIWIATAALIALGIVLALVGRQQVVERFPQAANDYRAVGLEVSKTGIRLLPVEVRMVEVDGRTFVRLRGKAFNMTDQPRWSPPVKVEMLDAGGEVLAEWSVDVGTTKLAPKEERVFEAEYPDPPLAATTLRYGLEEDG